VNRRFLPLAVVVVGLLFRFAVISQYRSTSPDGDQYYALEQSLASAHTLAYAAGAPPTWTRLPGYPLFLAATALGRPSARDADLLRATVFNQLLDAGTALLVFAIVSELLRGKRRQRLFALLAMALVFLAPPLFLFAAYRLTESLATFLTTLVIYCAVRAMRGEHLMLWAGLAGLFAGLGQLVRADVITVAPAIGLAIWFAREPLRRRALAGALALAAWCVALAPWALRNLALDGAPHLAAAEWPAQDGHPLPTGPIAWMRTWAAGRQGDADIAGTMVFERNLPPSFVRDRMIDSPAERERLGALLERYNHERLSPAVDGEFRALAAERRARAPLRYFVGLPAQRFLELYRAPRHAEFPLRIGFLGLPATRPGFDLFNVLLYLAALVGAWKLWRADKRLLAVLAAALVARTLLHLWAVPPFVSQRYLVEGIPLFIALSCAFPVDIA
jgi:4-amino-4-deoxy-L-arabinose transferase-like glycosyltransferase